MWGMTTPRRRPTHIVVAAGPGWRLSWPIDLWSTLSEQEQREVIDRQSKLLAGGRPGRGIVGDLARIASKPPARYTIPHEA